MVPSLGRRRKSGVHTRRASFQVWTSCGEVSLLAHVVKLLDGCRGRDVLLSPAGVASTPTFTRDAQMHSVVSRGEDVSPYSSLAQSTTSTLHPCSTGSLRDSS